jgi:uncharacterized protein YdbL (DUF1318 family)
MKPANFIAIIMLACLAQNALADEAFQKNVFSKRGRAAQINVWLSQGLIGEDDQGLLSVHGKSRGSIEAAVKDENAEREKNFKELSQKTGTTVMEQRKRFAKKRRKEIPKGSPVQEADGSWGTNI